MCVTGYRSESKLLITMAAEADLASATAAHILESKIDNNQKWTALNADGAEPFFLYLNASLAKTDSLSVVDTHELDIDATFRHFESLGMAHIECAAFLLSPHGSHSVNFIRA